jgi:hypothetical protein
MSNDMKPGKKVAWDNASRGLKLVVAFVGSVVCVAMVAVFVLRGCERSDTESKLVGSWRMNVNGTSITATYEKDHTLQMTFAGSVVHTQSGRWAISGSRLTLQDSAGRREILSIKRLDSSLLVLGGREPTATGRYEQYERTLTRLQ